MSRRLVVEADGGSRGNPGPAGYGAVVRDADTGEVLAERAASIGRATNNVAEYQGLLAGLRAALDLDPAAVEVRMDSKLVVEQMSGRWKVRHPDLAPLHAEGVALARQLPRVRFGWIPRERNAYADRLANQAMDAAAAGREWTPRAPAPARMIPVPATPGTRRATPMPAARGTRRRPTPARPGSPWRGARRRRRRPPCCSSGTATPRCPGCATAGGGTPRSAPRARPRRARWPVRLSRVDGLAAVVSSPLRRARSTAGAVAAAAGLDVVADDDLVETDFGRWDGRTFAEVLQSWPAEHAAWLADGAVAPPGGESVNQVARRVRKVRDRLLAAYPGRTVVVVSHVTPIKLLVCSALGAPASSLFRVHLDTASLSTVDWYPDGPAVVRLLNDTSHLT